MCGIIGAFNYPEDKKAVVEDANRFVIHQLQDQLARGQRGFGTIFINKKLDVKIERATELTKALLDLYLNKSKMIILHHRTPTSSENKISQTHPILVSNKELDHDYLFVHNGCISNEDERKEAHEKLGYKYTTVRKKTETLEEFNDTEALAIDVARYLDKKDKAIEAAGSCAFICLQTDKKTYKAKRVFFYRNGSNPLHLAKTRGQIKLSSEGPGDNIKEDTLYSFDFDDFKLKKKALVIATYKATTTTDTKPIVTQSYWDRRFNSYDDDDGYGATVLTGEQIANNFLKDDKDQPRLIGFEDKQDEEEGKEEGEELSPHDWYNETDDPLTKRMQRQMQWDADTAVDNLNALLAEIADPDIHPNIDEGYLDEITQKIFESVYYAWDAAANEFDKSPEVQKGELVRHRPKLEKLPEKLCSK